MNIITLYIVSMVVSKFASHESPIPIYNLNDTWYQRLCHLSGGSTGYKTLGSINSMVRLEEARTYETSVNNKTIFICLEYARFSFILFIYICYFRSQQFIDMMKKFALYQDTLNK
jgi:hypothetical protein